MHQPVVAVGQFVRVRGRVEQPGLGAGQALEGAQPEQRLALVQGVSCRHVLPAWG